VIELIHPEKSNVSKSDIKAKLAQTLKAKEENISIFGLKTKFGGGRSTGFALLYDSLDARKKYDSKKMLRRVSPRLPSHRTFLVALSGLRRTI
jgi:small subunit ribosomal protein S24e